MSHIIVFGGARGIGLHITRQLIKLNYTVTVADVDQPQWDELPAASLPNHEEMGRCIYTKCNIESSYDHIGRVFRKGSVWMEHFGGPALLGVVNTVGVFSNNQSRNSFHWCFDMNVGAMAEIMDAAIAHWATYGNDIGGRIVSIGSVSGDAVKRGDSIPYAVSKAALHHLIKHYAAAHPKHQINCISPSMVMTRSFVKAKDAVGCVQDQIQNNPKYGGAHPVGRIATPFDVAKTAVWLLTESPRFISGEILHVSNGYHNLIGVQ